MQKKLYLLDGMALVYRAHFALATRPIFNSQGVNTSAIFGFTQTLLDILARHEPTHIAVAFDTSAPTQRHIEYPDYKAQREAMPEDLSAALPHVRRIIEAFNIPILLSDGYEADDIIGTLVRRAEQEGFISHMVTPDKDFGQLVDEKTFLYKPSRMGEGVEILGLAEIKAKWGIERPEQVIDILGLWGDAADNIPGVPGIGEKTAAKLIAQYGSVENLLAHTHELKGKLKESLETHREQALLSKRLATINCQVPISLDLELLKLPSRNDVVLRGLCSEFEFSSLGRRLFGEDFKVNRGPASAITAADAPAAKAVPVKSDAGQGDFFLGAEPAVPAEPAPPSNLKTIADVPHDYHLVDTAEKRADLLRQLQQLSSFCVDVETDSLDSKTARLLGIAFSFAAHTGYYVTLPANDEAAARAILEEFRLVLENEAIEKVGHNLKYDYSVFKWWGVTVRGRLFDTMLAHSLVEPEMRHGMDHLSEVYLGYTPTPITKLIGEKGSGQLDLSAVPEAKVAEYSAEDADVTWQLRSVMEPLLRQRGQERVYYDIEAPLLPVLVDMEFEGIRIDANALAEFARQLLGEMVGHEKRIWELAGREFNLNSPKQLGDILFDELKIAEKPKKTKTGQYSTNEQTLQALATEHEIVQRLLDYRAATKLKSTYADTLPEAIFPRTNRVHTTYNQALTTTGRLQSQNPNLQNIPIRSEHGKEIRRAFVPRDPDHLLLAADYSQIELRIIAALSQETTMLEAFRQGLDIHASTASRVYGVPLDQVSREMRSKAKMVNFGIAYGISAFGLAQRLGIGRQEAATIIDQYFRQFPGIQRYINDTITFGREKGYVETVTGRRRYIRDLTSSNATTRGAAERNAINAPIQGTAADMIKIAMTRVHHELVKRKLKTRMLLQVHDELVFDLYKPEEAQVRELVAEQMKGAIVLEVPLEVEIGTGQTWLEAH